MCMTLGAPNRGSHPYLHRRVHSIDNRNITKFLIVCPTFTLRQCISVKRCRNQLLLSWFLEKIARNLFNGKLIKR